jgi:hypothetical protein
VTLEGVRLQIDKQPGRRTCAGLRVLVRRHLAGGHCILAGRARLRALRRQRPAPARRRPRAAPIFARRPPPEPGADRLRVAPEPSPAPPAPAGPRSPAPSRPGAGLNPLPMTHGTVAPTARIDPRWVTGGLKKPDHFFFLLESAHTVQTNPPIPEEDPRRGDVLLGRPRGAHHRGRSNHVSNPSGQFTC